MDDITENKFCNGHAYKYNGNLSLFNDYNIRITENYNQLTKNVLPIIQKYPFTWSIIPKGLGYYIYVSHYKGKKITYFIERKINDAKTPNRIYMLPNIFTNVPTETLFISYVTKCTKGSKWKFILQDILLHKGKEMYGDYGNRWSIMADYLEHANLTNGTVDFRLTPLLRFPINDQVIKNIETNEGIDIKYILFNNMSNHYNKRFNPFFLKYEYSNHTNTQKTNNLDLSKKYMFKITPNETYPDVYSISYNNYNIGIACVRTIEQSLKLQEIVNSNKLEGLFEYNPDFQGWEIVV